MSEQLGVCFLAVVPEFGTRIVSKRIFCTLPSLARIAALLFESFSSLFPFPLSISRYISSHPLRMDRLIFVQRRIKVLSAWSGSAEKSSARLPDCYKIQEKSSYNLLGVDLTLVGFSPECVVAFYTHIHFTGDSLYLFGTLRREWCTGKHRLGNSALIVKQCSLDIFPRTVVRIALTKLFIE